jgi:hypothetical protein
MRVSEDAPGVDPVATQGWQAYRIVDTPPLGIKEQGHAELSSTIQAKAKTWAYPEVRLPL